MNNISLRNKAANQIRQYFVNSGLDEVITPLLGQSATLEPYLDTLQVSNAKKSWVLPTSPEFGLKKQLALEAKSTHGVFEIAHAFRDDKKSKHHAFEFIMVEWYRRETHYLDLTRDLKAILKLLTTDKNFHSFEKYSIVDIFSQQNIAITKDTDYTNLIVELNLRSTLSIKADKLSNHDCFEIIFDQVIIPELKSKAVCFLYDFPSFSRGMACINEEGFSQRLECYLYGIEVANGYQEIYNQNELRNLWQANNQIRLNLGKHPHVVDDLLIELTPQMKGVAGMALGLERLLMVVKRIDSITKFQ